MSEWHSTEYKRTYTHPTDGAKWAVARVWEDEAPREGGRWRVFVMTNEPRDGGWYAEWYTSGGAAMDEADKQVAQIWLAP